MEIVEKYLVSFRKILDKRVFFDVLYKLIFIYSNAMKESAKQKNTKREPMYAESRRGLSFDSRSRAGFPKVDFLPLRFLGLRYRYNLRVVVFFTTIWVVPRFIIVPEAYICFGAFIFLLEVLLCKQ